MIEASGDDQNGGIFSLESDFTLLNCPPKDKKPALLKKFGSWDEGVENLAKFPIHAVSKNGVFITASSDVSIEILFILFLFDLAYIKIYYFILSISKSLILKSRISKSRISKYIFLSSQCCLQDSSDMSGTIVSSGNGDYMTSLKKPSVVKLWIREGGRYVELTLDL